MPQATLTPIASKIISIPTSRSTPSPVQNSQRSTPQMTKSRSTLGIVLTLALVACGGNSGGTPPPGGGGSSSVSGLLILPGQVGENPTPAPPPTGNTFSGTVTAPAGKDVKDTLVAACVVTSPRTFDCKNTNSKGGKITSSGSSANFTISGLAAVDYIAYAWNDLDGSGSVTANDYLTFYGDDGTGTASIIKPPKTGVNLPMYIVTGTTSAKFGGAFLESVQLQNIGGEIRIDTNLRNDLHPQTKTEFVPGQVILKFRDGGVQTRASLQTRVGNRTLAVTRLRSLGSSLADTSLYSATVTDAAGTLEMIKQLGARADVEYAEPNYISYALKTPNDTAYVAQWHYKAMNLENTWGVVDGTAAPVTVAVVDTGSSDHPDLQNTFVGGYDFISDQTEAGDGDARDADPHDLGGDSGYHGSHVAGTIAAQTNNAKGVAGVNWGAKVVPVRVLGVNGSGSGADIAAGIQWAAGIHVDGVPDNPNPAKVINLSLGGNRTCSQSEQQLYTSIKAKGVIVVVAAGNEDDNANNHAPASCKDVITVGATGPQGARAPYSNYGPRIDIMAPGGDTKQTFSVGGKTYPAGVLSTLIDTDGTPVYGFYQGTSMATPHVAGLVSLMLSRDPSLSFDTVLARLKAASSALTATTCNRPSAGDCGAGLVDALKAVNASGTNPPPPGPPPPPPPTTGKLETYVAALRCAQANNCNLFDTDGSVIVVVQANSSQVPFKLSGMKAGTYIAAGWQDVNGNQKVDTGEPFGFVINPVVIGDSQNLAGLVIRMKPLVEAAASAQLTASKLEETFGRLARR
jgi:serine protease